MDIKSIDHVTIAADVPAVDAFILPKGAAVSAYADAFGISLENMGSIADAVKDLSFLLTDGIGLAAAPANAQDEVKKAVLERNGHVSKLKVYDAFEEFYAICGERGITHIVSDRDGVLKDGSNSSYGQKFAKLALEMGQGSKPFVAVLTGSSFEQNLKFMKLYGLDERLASNPEVQKHPFLLAAENGAIHYNVLTGETKNFCNKLNPDLLQLLKGEFEEKVLKKVENVLLPIFNLKRTYDYGDQCGKAYVPPKKSMVTINVPRQYADKTPGYRKSEEAATLRQNILEVMVDMAERVKLPYKIIK